ncbi:MAG: protein tyrosine phosphatase [Hyphomicrobiales bacterium]
MIIVTSLREAERQLAAHGARRAISILSPDTPHPTFNALPADHHLRLTFHDVADDVPGLEGPRASDVERLITFLRDWDQQAPLLIHCWAGISRSTAAAYTAMCLLRPNEDEGGLAWELREASPSATPNRMIVAQADEMLGRGGRMSSAITAIGRGANAFEGSPFTLSVT